VKNQGSCGCCWSFSSIGAVESAWAISTQQMVDLAEQPLVDCVTSSIGCNGGYPGDALNYIANNGAEPETADPYQAAYSGSCTFDSTQVTVFANPPTAVNKNQNDLLDALRNIGPIAITVGDASTDTFQLYSGGVIKCPANVGIDHALLLIGVSYEGNYFIVKNQWDTDWGINGFFWMDLDQNCGIYSQSPFSIQI